MFLICTGPPQITALNNAVATVGATLVLNCISSGDAPLSFQWRFSGRALANNARISGARTGTLTISRLTESDNGTYTCIATNSYGNDSAEASVIVIG